MKPLLNISTLLQDSHDADRQAAQLMGNSIRQPEKQARGAEVISDIITCLSEGLTAHFYTNGAWSMYELLIALTEITGPCKVSIATYAMSETAARALNKLKESGIITELHCLIDNRVDTRSAGSLQLLQSISDSCSMAACHAKATIIQGKEISICIIGSANYTENNRLECGIASTDPVICAFHKDWITQNMNHD